jgi:hypothetical protein
MGSDILDTLLEVLIDDAKIELSSVDKFALEVEHKTLDWSILLFPFLVDYSSRVLIDDLDVSSDSPDENLVWSDCETRDSVVVA